MNLEEIREKIDAIDEGITALLLQRMRITAQVAAYKREHDLPVLHPRREQQILARVRACGGEEYGDALVAIYECIMQQSRRAQSEWLCAQEAEEAHSTHE